MIRALFVGALFALTALSALAHDADGYSNWVSGLVNPLSGADCCGLNDCKEIPAGGIEEKAGGYLDKATGDVVPYSNVLWKSPDGKWCHCLALLWQIFRRARDSQITFSVTHGWSAFWRGRPWLAGRRIGETSSDVGSSRFWIGWVTKHGDKCARSTCRD